jgi:hypothetical protein
MAAVKVLPFSMAMRISSTMRRMGLEGSPTAFSSKCRQHGQPQLQRLVEPVVELDDIAFADAILPRRLLF